MSNKILKCKSRELRGGQLYAHCDCKRRNGLQYDCQRRDCLLSDQKSCLVKPFPKCCASLYANRFENVSMGKPTYSDGSKAIRVFDSGKCVNEYDPRGDMIPINPPNQCGPKYDCNRQLIEQALIEEQSNDPNNKHRSDHIHHDTRDIHHERKMFLYETY